MRINKITFYNYCQYYGKQMFNIPDRNDDRNIIIIKGENGAGKTNFINGLTWCLYNENVDSIELINDKAKYETQDNDEISMFIKINFKNKRTNYILTRKIIGIKKNNNINSKEEKYKLEKIKEAERDIEEREIFIEEEINNILNESVKNYFFFDGAQIESFIDEQHHKDVKKAVKNLLRIEAIKRSKDHIQKLVDEYRKNLKTQSHNEQLNNIKEELDRLNNKKEEKEEELKNINLEINSVKNEIEITKQNLDEIEKNSKYKEKKDSLEKDARNLKDSINKLEQDIEELLEESYICFAQDLLNDVADYIDEKYRKVNKEKFDPIAEKKIINKSIDKNKCKICGRELGESEISKLKRKLPELNLQKDETQKNIIKFTRKLEAIKQKGQNNFDKLNETASQINEEEEELDTLNKHIEKYDSLINNDIPNISSIKETLKNYEEKKDRLIEDRTKTKDELQDIKEDISQKEYEENNILNNIHLYQEEKKQFNIAKEMRKEINRIFGRYEAEEIKKINKKFKRIFDVFIRKEEVFKEVYIDNKYRINVNRKYTDSNIVGQLSQGESQLLSLSLIMSLAHVSEDTAPFIIDTPMGNLDNKHSKKMVKNVPSFVNQLFLLVRDNEFPEDLYKICSEKIAVEYHLDIQKEGLTNVREET